MTRKDVLKINTASEANRLFFCLKHKKNWSPVKNNELFNSKSLPLSCIFFTVSNSPFSSLIIYIEMRRKLFKDLLIDFNTVKYRYLKYLSLAA